MQLGEGGSISFWQDEAQSMQQRYAALEQQRAVEVVIIGGGITGTASALWLSRAGRNVALLERETVAHGASGRNGGFLISGTAETYERAIALYGRERARRLFTFSAANNRTVRELAAELEAQGWATGYRHTGSLRLADSPAELAEVQQSTTLLAEDGWPAEVISEDHLPPCLRGHYLGGVYFPDDGELQPARFVLGLARLAEQAGASLYERTPALSIRETEHHVMIETPAGTMQAQIAIIATNAWLGELLRCLPAQHARFARRIVLPTRGQMLATAPVAERLFECPIYAHYGYQYWRQLPDGRLIVGGWRDHAPDRDQHEPTQAPTHLVQRYLDQFLFETLRLPANTPITHRWAGLMAFTPDSLPVVGWAPESQRILLCGGYTGHGNAMAVRCAQVAADLAGGKPNAEAELFSPARFTDE